MSPLGSLRRLSGREICKILEQEGFVQVRQRGSHAVMQLKAGDTTRTVPVPLHNEVAIGALRAIIRQCGVPSSRFETGG